MNIKNNIRTRLGMECLEDRTVPTYFGTSGGESVAIGAVLSLPGPGPDDVILGAGPGEVGVVRIMNSNNKLLQSFFPFGQGYTGGVYVASGDVTGDGHDDVICATAKGTVGKVEAFEFINGGMQLISEFFPFGANFTGGIDVAVGNVTGPVVSAGSGNADQIVAGMASGGSMVSVFGYDDNDGTPQYDHLSTFQACISGYTGGVTLAVADIDTQTNPTTGTITFNHNYASIITGRAQGFPVISIWNAQQPTVVLRAQYFAFNNVEAGVNVAAGDTDDARGAEIYANLNGTGLIRVFNGQTSAIITTIDTYPPAFGTMVNMAVGGVGFYAPTQDDEVTPSYYTRDVVVVAANISFQQTPVVLISKANKPAGLNGSYAL